MTDASLWPNSSRVAATSSPSCVAISCFSSSRFSSSSRVASFFSLSASFDFSDPIRF